MTKRTLIVELASGPCGGKSTEAAALYAALKQRHVSCELAREYVKRWAWEGRAIAALDEFYVLGKQIHEESSLLGKVEVVIVDRPVFMSQVYTDLYAPSPIRRGITEAVRSYYEAAADAGHRRVVVLLPRRHSYQEAGRYESEAEARKIDALIEGVVGNSIVSEDFYSAFAHPRGYVGLYKYSNDADFCDGADVAVDVTRWLAARKRRRGGA